MNLRLLLFKDCNRRCRGCCNKGFDLDNLPVIQDFTGYECIMLTGGEPMLKPEVIRQTVANIRKQTNAPIIVYTAKYDDVTTILDILSVVDGLTVTLHVPKDLTVFQEFNNALERVDLTGKSLRLNVFNNVHLKGTDVSKWKVKKGIKWIKDCPLPTNEKFMRL